MAPEDKESLITSPRSLKASHENPFHVSGHPPHNTNPNWPKIGIHIASIIDPIAPVTPIENLTTDNHEKRTCKLRESAARYVIIRFLLCDWRYVWNVNENMYEKLMGMNQRAMVPAVEAIDSSWPRKRSRGAVKMKRGTIRMVHIKSTIHDLWR